MTWTRWCILPLLALGCQAPPSDELILSLHASRDISLPYTSGTGYVWSLDRSGSEGLSFVRVAEAGTTPDTANLPGGPGQSHWSVEGRAQGTATLRFEYHRPWEQNTPPAKTRRVRVEVR
jgi:predicted secreted protein